ncbi:MAG: serine hydrolase domain-containing protein [Acidobacteriaceae bacterium]
MLAPRIVCLLALSLAVPLAASAQTTPYRQLNNILSTLVNPQSPGIALLVRSHGRTLFQHAYGLRDLTSRTPNDEHTNFRLASCTKQFTATAIMLLVRDGKLRYDTRLTDVFPDFPDYARSITIRNLLNHTAGLPDYEDLMADRWSPTHQIDDAEVLTLLRAQPKPRFAAGTKWSYSNSGYVVLGAIVAKVSGMTYPEFLARRIFQPLHMQHTLAFVNGTNTVINRAYGHTRTATGFEQTDQSSTSATLGDGGIYSNLEDLARWDDAIAHHTLLTAAEFSAALAPFRLPDGSLPRWSGDSGDTDPLAGKPAVYGFGWFLDPYRGHQRMWHYGDTIGFMSDIERFPDDELTIVVLANRTDLDRAELVRKITDLYLH